MDIIERLFSSSICLNYDPAGRLIKIIFYTLSSGLKKRHRCDDGCHDDRQINDRRHQTKKIFQVFNRQSNIIRGIEIMLKAGHYTDLLRQVNELKRQLHLVGKVQL
jgi:hypothetical protein